MYTELKAPVDMRWAELASEDWKGSPAWRAHSWLSRAQKGRLQQSAVLRGLAD